MLGQVQHNNASIGLLSQGSVLSDTLEPLGLLDRSFDAHDALDR